MIDLGFVAVGATIHIPWASYSALGASATATGYIAADVEIYKNGSTTQRSSDNGVTATTDFDSLTGLHLITIDLSDNSDASFFAAGSVYLVAVSSVTVDSQTVSFWAARFSIGPIPANVQQFGGTAGTFASGRPDVNATYLGGTAQTGRDVGASVLLSTGTGTGQLDFTSGVVKANLAQILGTALTETAGLLAGGFKKFFNVATPTGTVNSLADVVPGAAGGGFIAGTNAATTITTALTTTFTGNVTGSVGSMASGGIARASFAADTGLQSVRSNTAQTGAAGTVTLDASASAATDFYVGDLIVLTGGTGAIQARVCTAYNGTTKVATIAPNWATNPDNTSTFAVLAGDHAKVDSSLQVTAASVQGNVTGSVATLTNAPSDSSGVTTLLSRLSSARAGYLDNLSAGAAALEASLQGLITTVGASAAGVATAVWGAATRLLTAGTNIALAKGTGVTGFNDLSAAQVNAEADTALADVGVTTPLSGRLDAAVSTRAPEAGGNVAAIKTQTDKLVFTVANQIDANVLDWKSATAPAMTGDAYARLGAPAGASTAADLAAVKVDTAAVKVKTDSLTFTVAGQADANVLDWKSATAPAMTGDAYARLGAPAGASTAADIAAVKAETAAIKAKTDNLPAAPAAVGNIPTAAANADAVWEEAIADHDGTAGSTAEALTAAAAGGGGGGLNAAGMRAALGMASANLDTQLAAIDGNVDDIELLAAAIDSDVVAIKAKTDNLPTDPASSSDVSGGGGGSTGPWTEV